LREEGRKAFVAFVTAGDPSLERTIEVALELERAGVDILELGVPFSDPLADGPVIQRASDRALAGGTTLARVLDVVRRIRERSELPLLLFSSLNPLLRFGLPRLATQAREAGVDGVLVTDLPPEEAEEWLTPARGVGLDTVTRMSWSLPATPALAPSSSAHMNGSAFCGKPGEGDTAARCYRSTTSPSPGD